VLLAVVALLLWAEQRAQARIRFTANRPGTQSSNSVAARPLALQGGARLAAWAVCGLPVLVGFVLPVAWLVRLLWRETGGGDSGPATPVLAASYLARFADWALASFRLAALAAAAAVVFALLLAFALRRAQGQSAHWLRGAARVVSLGYAVPGAVVAIGILLWVGAVQSLAPAWGLPALVTGTVFGLLYAYMVRFSAVALQSVQSGYARVPPSIDESARLLGAGRRRTFIELHLPLLGRTTMAAALLVFVDTMKELPATLIVRPFDFDTLAVRVHSLAADERLAEASTAALLIVVAGLSPVLALTRAMRRA
jgi:iron(III) transport system permease protein